ncbi:hypothetical protein PR048_016117 [Dryococelus australis]|uniref:Katanin p80 WD40 repeat-containing subunit B1 n=1 Tax=Dryococelus australis TaxID=614101 RepID=A0ABQ9HJ90_9NEOP|nr:hypothetical protein PR048_016117 [Dryococelus australis]
MDDLTECSPKNSSAAVTVSVRDRMYIILCACAVVEEFVAHGSNVNCLALGHKSGRVLVTGGDDKKVNLWAVGKHSCIMSLSGHMTPVECVRFGHTEELVCAGSQAGAIKIWDLEAAKLVRTLTGHKCSIRCVDFHPYGDFLISGSLDTSIKMWDIRRRGCIYTYKGHKLTVNSLKFSPDGQWVASGGEEGTVKIWDLRTGRLLKEFVDHTGPVTAVQFHPNEFLLASSSADRSVNFWDLEKFQVVSTTAKESAAIRSINFSTGGECLFAGMQDVLRVYGWEPARTLDVVHVGWGRIQDMATINTQLVGAAFFMTNVLLYVVDLQKVRPLGKVDPDLPASPFAHGQSLRKSFSREKPLGISKPMLGRKREGRGRLGEDDVRCPTGSYDRPQGATQTAPTPNKPTPRYCPLTGGVRGPLLRNRQLDHTQPVMRSLLRKTRKWNLQKVEEHSLPYPCPQHLLVTLASDTPHVSKPPCRISEQSETIQAKEAEDPNNPFPQPTATPERGVDATHTAIELNVDPEIAPSVEPTPPSPAKTNGPPSQVLPDTQPDVKVRESSQQPQISSEVTGQVEYTTINDLHTPITSEQPANNKVANNHQMELSILKSNNNKLPVLPAWAVNWAQSPVLSVGQYVGQTVFLSLPGVLGRHPNHWSRDLHSMDPPPRSRLLRQRVKVYTRVALNSCKKKLKNEMPAILGAAEVLRSHGVIVQRVESIQWAREK